MVKTEVLRKVKRAEDHAARVTFGSRSSGGSWALTKNFMSLEGKEQPDTLNVIPSKENVELASRQFADRYWRAENRQFKYASSLYSLGIL